MTSTFKNSKRTKIIATVGPATNSPEKIRQLIENGVNGIRFNFSHANYDDVRQQLTWIAEIAKELDKPVATIQDLQGPKVRLGVFDGEVSLTAGQDLTLVFGEVENPSSETLPLGYDISKKVQVGQRIYLRDGSIRGLIADVSDSRVVMKVENPGTVSSRKGINLPDTDFGGDVITEKDIRDIAFGAEAGFDFVAQSFVQTSADLAQLRGLLEDHNSDARIIAKIETKSAIDNIEDIIRDTDGVMVARGDLAVETPAESVPIEQRRIIGLAMKYAKTSIVATQMLQSMTERPEPTRAEVSDVATATIVGADAVMLSDETAMGAYPIETVQMMKRIITYTQENAPLKPVFYSPEKKDLADSISSAIITLAHQVDATAIVAETSSGATARVIASHRPSMPILMVTENEKVYRQLALVYGGKAYLRPSESGAAEKLTDWLRDNKIFESGDIIVSASGKYPGVSGGTDTIKVRTIQG